jgi:hypothetical protein
MDARYADSSTVKQRRITLPNPAYVLRCASLRLNALSVSFVPSFLPKKSKKFKVWRMRKY